MKMILSAMMSVVLAFTWSHAAATAQQSDLIVMDGGTAQLHSNPLQSEIESGRVTIPEPTVLSSANWRGYVATWAVRGDRLILKGIRIEMSAPKNSGKMSEIVEVLDRVFPGQTEVVATWYTGLLVIPSGELVNYVHMGYGSTYERYTLLHVKDGQIIRRRDLSAGEYLELRKQKFADFKKTTAYAEALRELKSDLDGESMDDFLFDTAILLYLTADP